MPQRTKTVPGARHTLAGVYELGGFSGQTLRPQDRPSGPTLSINDTRRRGPTGPRDAARYVSVTHALSPRYSGNLYGPSGSGDASSTDNLDGCEWQDRPTGIRYVIRETETPNVYSVTPKSEVAS